MLSSNAQQMKDIGKFPKLYFCLYYLRLSKTIEGYFGINI